MLPAEFPVVLGRDFAGVVEAVGEGDTMFSSAVYYRGGMTLAALRHKIGDGDFFRILRTWTATHHFGTATTAQFVALVERISGQDLSSFFQTWLWDKTKPPSFG